MGSIPEKITLPSGVTYTITLKDGMPYYQKSATAGTALLGPPVSGVMELSCPGLSPITVALFILRSKIDAILIPSIPQLEIFNIIECAASIVLTDAESNTVTSNANFLYKKIRF